jgi:hypothetical protein
MRRIPQNGTTIISTSTGIVKQFIECFHILPTQAYLYLGSRYTYLQKGTIHYKRTKQVRYVFLTSVADPDPGSGIRDPGSSAF